VHKIFLRFGQVVILADASKSKPLKPPLFNIA
jgi:hypothetical protein